MFAHGYGVTPSTYAALLSRIAQAGYVVVAPTYPILSGEPAGPSDTVGWDDLWPDTWFVTTKVLDLSASGSGTLGNLIDPQRIAVAGHSDGGYVAFGDGYQPFRLDPRVRAVASPTRARTSPTVGRSCTCTATPTSTTPSTKPSRGTTRTCSSRRR